MHLANPTQIFFPNKFHSTTVNEKIISLSIQTNRNDGWPRNKNALMPRFQLRWLYFFLGPSMDLSQDSSSAGFTGVLGSKSESVFSAQSLLPTSAGLVSHLLCDTLAITPSPLAPLHTGLWFGSVLLTTLLTKQCSQSITTSCCSTYLQNNLHFSDTPCFYWFWSCITHTTYFSSGNSLRVQKTCNWKSRTIGTTTTDRSAAQYYSKQYLCLHGVPCFISLSDFYIVIANEVNPNPRAMDNTSQPVF